jgi:glycosyltransferase involved in cell wall biosynthesis
MASMSDLPLISVLAANYNNGQFVLDALESIAAQTYPNIELIIVDDASVDNSPALIKEWLKSFNKPHKFIQHEKNYGLCRTCNDLVKNASGKYLSFIATDDMYLPGKIARQVAIMEELNGKIAMLYGDTYLMDEKGNRRFGSFLTTLSKCDWQYAPSGDLLEKLQEFHFVHWLSALVRKDVFNVVGYFDEDLQFEDYDMSIRIARKYQIQFDPEIAAVYRVHSSSISGKMKDWQTFLIPFYLKHLDIPRFRELASEAIVSAYLKKHNDTLKLLEKYNSLTGEKIKYQGWIKAGISPFILRQYLKGMHFLGRITKKLK